MIDLSIDCCVVVSLLCCCSLCDNVCVVCCCSSVAIFLQSSVCVKTRRCTFVTAPATIGQVQDVPNTFWGVPFQDFLWREMKMGFGCTTPGPKIQLKNIRTRIHNQKRYSLDKQKIFCYN